jgi:hypothetical protein
MNQNQYKQKTKYFQMPVPGWKDKIWPELELQKWQMVENLILAAMRGNVNAVFREGDMRIKQDSSGRYFVRLSATGNEPSLHGAVGGAYFEAPSSITWTGLEEGRSYYLYVKGTTKTFLDASDISTVASVIRLSNPNVTMVAKVDLTTDPMTIDRNPPGKVNARDLAQHVLDYDNPHGSKLSQDELLVRDHLVVGDGNDADLELDVNGVISHFPVSRLVSVLTKTRTVVNFVSSGSSGTILTASGKVVFANVVRTAYDTRLIGEVSVGFYGESSQVKLPNQIVVWNSGDAGIPMKAMIECE